MLEMQFVHDPHQIQVRLRNRCSFIIQATARDIQQLRLLRLWQLVLRVDHRFALGPSMRSSAPDKKSISSACLPIFACSALRSVACSTGLPPSKIETALSNNCVFHWVTQLGWMSNCLASSATVRSPLSAASATFALKALAWLRRERLAMNCSFSKALFALGEAESSLS